MYVRVKVTCGFWKQSAELIFVASKLSGPMRCGHLLNVTGDAAPEMVTFGIMCLTPARVHGW